MTKISFLNGEFLPHEKCLVSIEDRGFQFADGAYEVTLFENNKLIDGENHLHRMMRSLRELNINHDFSIEYLKNIQLELFKQNNISGNHTCYLQITRGSHPRVPSCPNPCKLITVKSLSANLFVDGSMPARSTVT